MARDPRRFCVCSVLLAGFAFATVMSLNRTARAATPEQVQKAIEKAKDWLYKQQNPKGTWERVEKPVPNGEKGNADPDARQWGGLTSLATYALLAAEESPQAPKLQNAISFLKTAPIEGIYATGMRCQVWLFLSDDKSVRPLIERDKEFLLRSLHQDVAHAKDNRFGFYPYYFERGKPHPADWYDHSVSQYGVLGMWALEQAGAEVPVRYWEVVDSAWRRAQYSDGGWSYRQKGPDAPPDSGHANETPQMAAAGIATLFITQEYLTADVVACKGNATNENIDRGLKWMDQHVSGALTSGNYYGMYGIERIGVASGHKYFGTTDWYDVGADYVVKHQSADGSWGGQWGAVPDTCFATFFLVRGRAPILMNKVQYQITEKGKQVEGNWNQRPRDVANFARWMGRQIERDLNWQSVNLKVSAEELHDAPILYFGGNQELNLSDEETAKIRTFIEEGGMVLGNADCGSRAFAISFEKLGTKLFPGYKFRDLPITHPIFTVEQYSSKRERHPRVAGLSNGVRELMLLIPDADLSRAWQARSEKTREESYHLAANIFLYAVDKRNLRFRGETYLVSEDPNVKTRKSIQLRRLQIGENWDPEPGGWQRLKAILHNNPYRLDLEVKPGPADSSLSEAKIAHLTGTKAFKLTDAERSAIKEFVEKGGTLIVDAAGGSNEFADAAENELNAIFGDAAAKSLKDPLPPENMIYRLPISPVEQVRYRTFAKTVLGNLRTPMIKAITIRNRPAVFFSREDLSAGLVGEAVDGITGYEPDVATAIMRNIILEVAGITEAPKPASKPSTKPATKTAEK